MFLLTIGLSALIAVGNIAGQTQSFTPADAVRKVPELHLSLAPPSVHVGARQPVTEPRCWWRGISVPGLDGTLDPAGKRGRLSLGGDDSRLLLHFDWKVGLDSNFIRVRSRINFEFLGRAIALTPPDLRIGPRFRGGGSDVVLQLPILEGRF